MRYPIKQQESEINLTPMLDVVFIMLIFFIVTTSFVKETGINVLRSNANNEPQQALPTAVIKLEQTDLSINGQAATLSGLESRLLLLKSQKPDLKAQLVADKNVDVNRLVMTMEHIQNAGISDVAVAAFEAN